MVHSLNLHILMKILSPGVKTKCQTAPQALEVISTSSHLLKTGSLLTEVTTLTPHVSYATRTGVNSLYHHAEKLK